MCMEEKTLLDYRYMNELVQLIGSTLSDLNKNNKRLLKLVTGVEISTRPVKRSGNEGKLVNRSSLSAAAAPKSRAFRRSIAIVL